MRKKILAITALVLTFCMVLLFTKPVMAETACTNVSCGEGCKGNCEETCTTECCPVQVEDKCYPTLKDAVAAAQTGNTITLKADVDVDDMINITQANITLDLGTHKLTSSENFSGTGNGAHLINIGANNVTVKNGTLETTTKNKHGINVYQSTGAILENLKIDHTNSLGGAPIVVNGSTVSVKGNLELVLGANSWYGINIDPKGKEQASLKFETGSSVKSSGDSSKLVIYPEPKNGQTDPAIVVTGAENAGLAADENGNYVVTPKQPEQTPATQTPSVPQGQAGQPAGAPASAQPAQKDETPKTGSINEILIATIVTTLSLAGIVVVNKYNK